VARKKKKENVEEVMEEAVARQKKGEKIEEVEGQVGRRKWHGRRKRRRRRGWCGGAKEKK